MIIFMSDHGGAHENSASNGELRGWKNSLWDGGVKVPLFVCWPGVISRASVSQHVTSSLDLAPTILAAAGSGDDLTQLDGMNLLPLLKGEVRPDTQRTLYWRSGRSWAIRHGGWKLIYDKRERELGLYHLRNDPGEKTNQMASEPERAKQMQQLFDAWAAQMMAPLWQEDLPKRQGNRRNAQSAERRRGNNRNADLLPR